MEKWEYRIVNLNKEKWKRGRERYEDYVVTYTDGTRFEGLEMIMRSYLDVGGWELVSLVPTGFKQIEGAPYFVADSLTAIFRRKFVL